jgi:hypothetical protein
VPNVKKEIFRLGLAVASFILISGSSLASNIVVNPSFEVWESTGDDLPTSYGNWSGDESTIVNASQGILPTEGDNMLQFIYALADRQGNVSVASSVIQLIDMSPWRNDIDAGKKKASAKAYYNRVHIDAETDTQFDLGLYAVSGSASDFPALLNSGDWMLAVGATLYSDSDTTTWELLNLETLIPRNTDFLALLISTVENIHNDKVGGVEFDGHFADSISLELTTVPVPGAVWLLGSGLIGLLGFRRKFKKG